MQYVYFKLNKIFFVLLFIFKLSIIKTALGFFTILAIAVRLNMFFFWRQLLSSRFSSILSRPLNREMTYKKHYMSYR